MQVKYFSPRTRMGIIKVPRDHCKMLLATLALITHVNKVPCTIRVLHVSGTIKSCQRTAVKIDRELLVAWHQSQQALSLPGSTQLTGTGTLASLLKESESQISALEL
ncbi:RNA-binding protein pop5 [Coemansia sp. RSA 552]|nr:RNA-binding protein pop5 [Coemansia sp. RSA 552]